MERANREGQGEGSWVRLAAWKYMSNTRRASSVASGQFLITRPNSFTCVSEHQSAAGGW